MVWAKCTLRRFSGGLFMVRIITFGLSLAGSTVRLGKGGECCYRHLGWVGMLMREIEIGVAMEWTISKLWWLLLNSKQWVAL